MVKRVQSQNSPRKYLKESSPRMRPCFRCPCTHTAQSALPNYENFAGGVQTTPGGNRTPPQNVSSQHFLPSYIVSLDFSFLFRPSNIPPISLDRALSPSVQRSSERDVFVFSCLWLSQLPCMTNWFQTLTLGFPARRLCLERKSLEEALGVQGRNKSRVIKQTGAQPPSSPRPPTSLCRVIELDFFPSL